MHSELNGKSLYTKKIFEGKRYTKNYRAFRTEEYFKFDQHKSKLKIKNVCR